MPDISHYSTDQADIIVQAIANGHTTFSASQMAGISHATAYNWRKQYPEFAERWAEAVDIATDCVESIVAHAAMSGNLTAAFYWLKHHRPRTYNRESLVKLAMLNAAIQSQAARGGGRLTITVDANGIPQITENAQQSAVKIYMPDNGRGVVDGKADPPPEAQELSEQHQLSLELPLPQAYSSVQRLNPTDPAPQAETDAQVIERYGLQSERERPLRPNVYALQQRWKALSE
jgi:hypothetical protein